MDFDELLKEMFRYTRAWNCFFYNASHNHQCDRDFFFSSQHRIENTNLCLILITTEKKETNQQ